MYSWWETPLCSKYLTNIADEIWSGQVVLAFLPLHTPNGFVSELKQTFKERDINSFIRIDLDLCKNNELFPIESILHSHFQLDDADYFVGKRVPDIFDANDQLISELIIFENLKVNLFAKFKTFLAEYCRFANQRIPSNRHKILVIIDPKEFRFNDFAGEVGISRILFEGIFDKLDQQLALRYILKLDFGDSTPYVENLITTLSQFDYSFSEMLCSYDNLLEECRDICNAYAIKNEWRIINYIPISQLTDDDYWFRWARGIAEKKNGEIIYHTGYLSLHGKYAEINKRNWQAGIEIILPMVETIRQKILNCPKFLFPEIYFNELTKELIEDKFEFEIGQILYLWNSKITFIGLTFRKKEQLYHIVALCKTIRDDLAHLRIPQVDDITKFYKAYNDIDNLLS